MPKICVVGSSNLDMNSYVPRFPQVGETLHGHRFTTGYGGKGANQAVMAARLGGAVSMVAKVGDDLFGRDMLANFRAEGIDDRYISVTKSAASGVAVITIDDAGSNTIIVSAGANWLVTPADVEQASAVIQGADVLVCQLEVPFEATLAALRLARAAGVRTILNPAPAQADLPAEMIQLSDIFCPNEGELQLLTGQRDLITLEQIEAAARSLLARGAVNVIVTLGERGSLLVNGAGRQHVLAPLVRAVDTTGAGDAFVGSLAYYWATGAPLTQAMQRANQIAAISVQSPGAQSSFPHAKDLGTLRSTDF